MIKDYICSTCGISFKRDYGNYEWNHCFCSPRCSNEFPRASSKRKYLKKTPLKKICVFDPIVADIKKLCKQFTYNRQFSNRKKKVKTCCIILRIHHNMLKGDPERLSTEFIKNMSGCNCKEDI